MRLVKNYIKQNLNIKSLLKIIWIFSILWLCISSTTFAQGQTTSQDGLEFLNVNLNTLLSLLSRLRIFLAGLAGKLMSNDWVYWSAIHLDIYLWKLRNIMKNFANFTLVALVLVEIVKIAIGKSKEWVSKIFKNTLLAAVLIQASWFVMWAMVDISNITVSAVGSFPRIFMQESKEFSDGLKTFANDFQQASYEIDFEKNEVIKQIEAPTTTPIQESDIIQSILPKTNSVSGPLIFMWASIFRFNEYSSISGIEKPTWKTLTPSISLKLLVIFFFTIALLFLVVANIIRIWFLWMFIVLSPIIVLYLTSFVKAGKDPISKYFSLWNVLSAVFKPTIFVWYISLMLVVLVLIKSFFVVSPNAEIWWATIVTNENTSILAIEWIGSIETKWNIMKDTLSQWQSMFSDLFVFLLGIFLMRTLMKLALTDKWPIWETMNKMWLNAELVEWVIKNMPVMPWGFWINAYRGALQNQTKEVLDKWFNVKRRGWLDFSADLDREWSKLFKQKISSLVWDKIGRDNGTHWRELQRALETNWDFWWKSVEIARWIEGWLSVNNTEWMWYVKQWIDKNPEKNWFKWKMVDTTEDELKKFFVRKENIEAFNNLMIGAGGVKFSDDIKRDTIKDYEDLRKANYIETQKSE